MKNKFARAGIVLLAAAGVGIGGLTISAPAAAAPVAVSVRPAGEVGVLSAWQYDYYHDSFYSSATCESRGYKMKYVEHVTGVLNWHCHQNSGTSKWSMDVLWST